MLDNIIGSIFFEFVGAFIKWLFYAIIYKIKGKKIIGFKEMWEGRKGSKKFDLLMNGTSNIILGLIVTITLILLLIQLEKRL